MPIRPKRGVDFTAEYTASRASVKWIDYTSEDPYGKVDLNKALDKANSTAAYAAAEFMADKPGNVEIRLATTNANKIWLNGELLTQNNVYHAGEQMDQYIGKGKVKAGRNIILVKVLQNHQNGKLGTGLGFPTARVRRVGHGDLGGRTQTVWPVTREGAIDDPQRDTNAAASAVRDVSPRGPIGCTSAARTIVRSPRAPGPGGLGQGRSRRRTQCRLENGPARPRRVEPDPGRRKSHRHRGQRLQPGSAARRVH